MALQEPLRDIIDYRELIFGFLILIFAMFYPQGIAGFLEYFWKRATAVLGSSK